jgi:hypothetical protein
VSSGQAGDVIDNFVRDIQFISPRPNYPENILIRPDHSELARRVRFSHSLFPKGGTRIVLIRLFACFRKPAGGALRAI